MLSTSFDVGHPAKKKLLAETNGFFISAEMGKHGRIIEASCPLSSLIPTAFPAILGDTYDYKYPDCLDIIPVKTAFQQPRLHKALSVTTSSIMEGILHPDTAIAERMILKLYSRQVAFKLRRNKGLGM